MSTILPPVPHQAEMVDDHGRAIPVWSDWFKQLFARVGGNIANTNVELYSVTNVRMAANSVGTSNIIDGNVTLAKLAAAVQTALQPPSGSMLAYGGAVVPTGYLLCDGSAVSRTTYSSLFSALGTTYGVGDGSTTFNVPNLRGVFPRGAGSQTIIGITYSATLGASQADAMQGHRHQIKGIATNLVGGGSDVVQDSSTSTAGGTTLDPATDGTNGTPRTAAETRPANVAVNWIIKT